MSGLGRRKILKYENQKMEFFLFLKPLKPTIPCLFISFPNFSYIEKRFVIKLIESSRTVGGNERNDMELLALVG